MIATVGLLVMDIMVISQDPVTFWIRLPRSGIIASKKFADLLYDQTQVARSEN
jgi:hypothetical protein